jgi:hypothetical protein
MEVEFVFNFRSWLKLAVLLRSAARPEYPQRPDIRWLMSAFVLITTGSLPGLDILKVRSTAGYDSQRTFVAE